MSLDNLKIFFRLRGSAISISDFPIPAPVTFQTILEANSVFPTFAVQYNIGHPERYLSQNYVGHFFIDDGMFERVWNSPARYLKKLRNFSFLAAPDFSCFSNTPLLLQRMAVYRSRLLTCFFQQRGLLVVPVLQYSANFSWQNVLAEFPLVPATAFCVRLPGVSHSAFEHELLLKNLEFLSNGQELIIFVPVGYKRDSTFLMSLSHLISTLFLLILRRKLKKFQLLQLFKMVGMKSQEVRVLSNTRTESHG